MSVMAALSGGDVSITLHGIAGMKSALVQLRVLAERFCGRVLKERAVYAVWTPQGAEYGAPASETERRERQ